MRGAGEVVVKYTAAGVTIGCLRDEFIGRVVGGLEVHLGENVRERHGGFFSGGKGDFGIPVMLDVVDDEAVGSGLEENDSDQVVGCGAAVEVEEVHLEVKNVAEGGAWSG